MTIPEKALEALLNSAFKAGAAAATIRIEKKLDEELGDIEAIDVMPDIKRVIFQEPATIVIWDDGTKTVVKAQNEEPFDPEKGLAMAFIKKAFGNDGYYYEMFKAYCPNASEHGPKE